MFYQPRRLLIAFLLAGFSLSTLCSVNAQDGKQYDKKSDPKVNRRDGLAMLKAINDIVKRYYFDPDFRGLNLSEKYIAAEQLIKQQDYRWQIHRTIAQFLLDFNDSHTVFFPPDRLFRVEYGFSMMIIGENCFVTAVTKQSGAGTSGLAAGDRIESINGISPNRSNFWAINYLIYTLDPQENLTIKVEKADGKKSIDVKAKFLSPEERKAERQKRKKEEEAKPYTCRTLTPEVITCKLRTFVVEKEVVDKMMKEVAGYKKLVFDLRGNGGGYVATEQYLTGYFFDRKVKVGTEVKRDGKKERFAAPIENPFAGELLVVIDSQSASASEVFSRTIQIENRGKVLGDTSMGAVMTSGGIWMSLDAGTASIDFIATRNFSVNITIGDLIMSDGNRLEGIGVTPDHLVGPTPAALAMRTDPVLAFAASLAGVAITPEKAAELNFFIPKGEEESDKETEGSVAGS
ncbi:MAG: S41 family peptidase [bacterium]|nr:S41 family peptidase [bacterium]